MPVGPIGSLHADAGGLAAIATGGPGAKPANAKEAATQFEGLLIAEMLRSAHQASPASLNGDDDEDAESSTAFDLAAEQFAQMMAKQGGFGIARFVTSRLAHAGDGETKLPVAPPA